MKTQLMVHRSRFARVRPGILIGVGGIILLMVLGLYWLKPEPNGENPAPPATGEGQPSQLAAAVGSSQEGKRMRKPMEEVLGLEVTSVRLTAAGRAIDIRYKVVNPEKASGLEQKENLAYLVDETHRQAVGWPQSPPPMEMHAPTEGRSYYVMFKNTGGLQPGSKVSLVIGEAIATNLTVQ